MACGLAALLVAFLIAVAVPASGDTAGAGAAPANNTTVSAPAGNASATAGGPASGPAAALPGAGFDRWGWGGLGPGGILGAGACQHSGHAHGALWSYWSQAPPGLLASPGSW